MKLHQHIIHHVRKHTENIIAHVNRHQKKYIAGVGVLSGIAMFKLIGITVIFLGVSKMGGMLGADYYDAEYYATQTGGKINISNILDTGNTTNITGCDTTGIDLLSGKENNCPPPNTSNK